MYVCASMLAVIVCGAGLHDFTKHKRFDLAAHDRMPLLTWNTSMMHHNPPYGFLLGEILLRKCLVSGVITCYNTVVSGLMAGDSKLSKLPGAHFIIGGDGTHRGAYEMAELMKEKNWNCSAPWLRGGTFAAGQYELKDLITVGIDQYVVESCVTACV